MRSCRVVVMVSQAEAERLKALASSEARSVSGFVRYKLFSQIAKEEADDAATFKK